MKALNLTLIEKNKLTHDVWELIYKGPPADIQPGQFLLCDCDANNPKLKRSYSISWKDGGRYEFIIKRLEDGKGGSKAICDQEVGHEMISMGPMGHFVLQDTPKSKVFIGTGTGFAPLYYQMKSCLESCPEANIRFIFGVRENQDVFYEELLNSWVSKYPNFSYRICLSRGSGEAYHNGYVTDLISEELVKDEFYICGSPAMVKDARSKLEAGGISEEKIFFEQY